MSAPTMPDVITAAVEFANASEAARLAVKRVRYARRVLDAARQKVPCPTCGDPLPGLLAQCDKPACLSVEIAEDHHHTRLNDI